MGRLTTAPLKTQINMDTYSCFTEQQVFDDQFLTPLMLLVAQCIESPSDHRIIVELGEKRGDKYYMIDFQDVVGSNTEYVGEPGTCCWISIMNEEENDPAAMFCGGYESYINIVDTIHSIATRGFTEIYTECY